MTYLVLENDGDEQRGDEVKEEFNVDEDEEQFLPPFKLTISKFHMMLA